VTPDDPQGRKPIMRLWVAILATFSFSAMIALWLLMYVAPPEPAFGPPARYASIVLFIGSMVWAVRLYRQWLDEGH